MAKRESWYERYPDYRVALTASDRLTEARFRDVLIATSTNTLVVEETNHDPVIYFPLSDVQLDYLRATDHHTVGPFQGEASYWSLSVDGEVAENVMWSYPEPFPEVAGLAGYAAFYPDRVVVIVTE